MTILLASQSRQAVDDRPPVVSVKMTEPEPELAQFKEAAIVTANARLALAADERAERVLEQTVISAHRTKELIEPNGCFINSNELLGYVARVEGSYIIYTLGRLECHPA